MSKPLYQLRIERDNYDVSLLPHINTTKLVEQTSDCLEVFLKVAAKCREASLTHLVEYWGKCVAVAVAEHETARADFRLPHWTWSGDELSEQVKAARCAHEEEKHRRAQERWLSKSPQCVILDILDSGPRPKAAIAVHGIAPEKVSRSLTRLKKLGKVRFANRQWALAA